MLGERNSVQNVMYFVIHSYEIPRLGKSRGRKQISGFHGWRGRRRCRVTASGVKFPWGEGNILATDGYITYEY